MAILLRGRVIVMYLLSGWRGEQAVQLIREPVVGGVSELGVPCKYLALQFIENTDILGVSVCRL
jgi:hypothetical protein